ncbi:MAG: LysM peptidoglycan-binding domain-containing protein [Lachnospiraceae bacterium]|nr:LysM peptidoglycan-binding domain-containing protein [Lachnospiraceae bacterium]
MYNEGSCRGMVHVIEKGDTLYRLGKQYHVSVGQLMFANPFVNVYNLQIGDELCIPISIQPRNPEGRMQGELMQGPGMAQAPGAEPMGNGAPEGAEGAIPSEEMGQGIEIAPQEEI